MTFPLEKKLEYRTEPNGAFYGLHKKMNEEREKYMERERERGKEKEKETRREKEQIS